MQNVAEFSKLQEIYRSEKTVVYTGIDNRTGQKISLKILNDDFPSVGFIAQFNGEAELSQQFDLQGVRKILEKRKINNRYALVMEHIEGMSWRELMNKGTVDLPVFFSLAIRVCDILSGFHKQGIIHKDINPRNLLCNDALEVWVIDFGIASILKKETQKFEAPEKLEGTLAYISPEQTGRMNHSIDSRSDLYSLGVTFYEMLVGELPFDATDPIELVHSHIAKMPPNLREKRPDLPAILEDIVMKLLAKNVEERYQTAEGVKQDLMQCWEIWQTVGAEAVQALSFALGSNDVKTDFSIPEKLYGRNAEREMLLEAFHSAEMGGTGFVLVGGHSGIGKTSLIRELYQPVTAKRSYFLVGKFEQFQRDIPYSAIVQAINGFVQQLLGESDRRLAHWKHEIMDALGENAGVLTEVIPSLELIIGKQSTPISLPPLESQNRFNRLFQRFFKFLSTPKHALIIFIDDWQWADQQSLHFLQHLITAIGLKHLLFIAAYRSNEVSAVHPFVNTVNAIREANVPTISLELEELALEHIEALLQDTLCASQQEIASLAKLIKAKTSGNPFFVSQFLQNIYDNAYIEYDSAKKKWRWDITVINKLPISDNVLDLMTTRLNSLPAEALELLKLASCIGNQFSLKLLSELADKTPLAVRHALSEALKQGFIVPHQGNQYAVDDENQDTQVYFKFLHDKVEQSAYMLVEEKLKMQNSLKIGRIAYHNNPEIYRQQWICDIASFYNKGKELIVADTEKIFVADINLKATQKAKKVNAYDSCIVYARAGIAFLGEFAWQNHFETCFELHKNLADSLFLQGEKEEAEQIFELLIQNAQNRLQKMQIYNMKNLLYESSARYGETIANARLALKILGIELPEQETDKQEAFQQEMAYISQTLQEQGGIGFFHNLPEMQHQEMREAVQILQTAWSSCYMAGDMNLVLLTSAQIISIAIRYGNTAETAWAYVAYATFVAAGLGQYELGYELGKLSIELNEHYNDQKAKGPIHHLMGTFLHHWRKPIRTGLHYFKTAFEASLASGNYGYAGYAHCVQVRHELLAGLPLGEIKERTEQNMQIQYTIKNYGIAQMGIVENAYVKNMMGLSKSKTSFDNEEFDEEKYLQDFKDLPIFHAIYEPLKARMYLYQDNYPQALLHTEKAMPVMISVFGSEWNWFHNVNHSLAMCGILREVPIPDSQRNLLLVQIEQNQTQLKTWVENCPENFTHHFYTIEAEIAQIKGDFVQAMKLYDKAIKWAQAHEFLQDEALAQELAAKFYFANEQDDFAKLYLQRAYHAYKNWGAKAKIELLKEKYKNYLNTTRRDSKIRNVTRTLQTTNGLQDDTQTSTAYADNVLDLLSVMKASQAISQEIKLESLLRTMVLVLMENAGADRALILQERNATLFVVAEAHLHAQEVAIMRPEPLSKEDRNRLALSVILHVYRTHESVTLRNAKKDKQFSIDSYIQQGKVKSLLCVPIIHQGEIRAVIYMEHSQIEGVFTKERVEILNMLSSQVAISMENSLLYNTMEEKVAKRTQELKEQKELVEHKNANIIASITYAQRIQQAILPLPEYLTRLIPEHFVLFQPKDIVSGDFYYLQEKEEKIVLAAIDCTGHGVPGAFMSMLGSETLNEIIQNKGILEPDQILNELHKSIRKALKQKETDNRDGMDLSMIVWDKANKVVYFAGAKNSLIYIQNGELKQIKGNIFPIGGEQKEANRVFTKHTIDLLPDSPTSFYLFSDGYQDQFGGEHNKKFSIGQMKTLFLEIHQQDMDKQQERLKKVLQKWMNKGKESQIDDVLLIGCRL
ncbi:MAG: GAF domain-containing protein [Bacteroidetes bacterium]|nr:MAG: GAF domain-containing protein [Bacteroidota bacterium]